MNKKLLIVISAIGIFSAKAQSSCEEMMSYVKSKSYGSSYVSYDSDAISKVTFYDVSIDYKYYYFAIVCFKNKYSYNCSEYIYQVSSNTKLNYSLHYQDSAGKAFWEYIQPYNKQLGCAPNME